MAQNDAFTRLLLHFDGADGSTTFTDSAWAQAAHTVTPNGNAQLDTAQSKFGGASLLLDGSGDYLSLDGSSDFAFGTGDFTIDCWIWRDGGTGGNEEFYDSRGVGDAGTNSPVIYVSSDGKLHWFANGNLIDSTTTVSTGAWHHVAVARSGTNTKLFLDGVQEGSTLSSDTRNYLNAANRPLIGVAGPGPGGNDWKGWIDELRVSKGTARWTANFTPPGSAYVDERAAAGAFTLTGIAAAFKTTLPATAASYVLTGQAAAFLGKLTAAVGGFAETGIAALFATTMVEFAGSYTLTGNAAVLTPTAIAASGSYALTGIAATFTDTLAATSQSYTISWQIFSDNETIAANAGTYAFAGNDALFSYDIDLGGVGSSISGGTFSRGRWRELQELERQAREDAELARRRIEDQARDAAQARAAERRAAIAAAAQAAQRQAQAEQEDEEAAVHLLLLS